jgi:hypothetical protein
LGGHDQKHCCDYGPANLDSPNQPRETLLSESSSFTEQSASVVIVALNCAVGIPYEAIERPAISQF